MRKDQTPVIYGFLNGDRCAVNDNERCEDVVVDAYFFAINPASSCKVVVSTESIVVHQSSRGRLNDKSELMLVRHARAVALETERF